MIIPCVLFFGRGQLALLMLSDARLPDDGDLIVEPATVDFSESSALKLHIAGDRFQIHRLRHGSLPETLDELVPHLLPEIPVDP